MRLPSKSGQDGAAREPTGLCADVRWSALADRYEQDIPDAIPLPQEKSRDNSQEKRETLEFVSCKRPE